MWLPQISPIQGRDAREQAHWQKAQEPEQENQAMWLLLDESLGVHLLDSTFSNAYMLISDVASITGWQKSSSTMNCVAVHGNSFETLNCLMNVASMFEVICHPLDVSSAPRPSVIAKKRRNKDIDQVHEDLKAHKAMGTKNWFGNTKLIWEHQLHCHKWNEKLGGMIFNHTSWHVPSFQGNLLKWFVKMSPAVVFQCFFFFFFRSYQLHVMPSYHIMPQKLEKEE